MAFSDLPPWTLGCLLVASFVTLGLLVWGVLAVWRWRRDRAHLREIRKELQENHGFKGHRQLHRTFDEIKAELAELGKGRPGARRVINELLVAVNLFHDRKVVGAPAQWEDVRDPVLESHRKPVRLARSGANWVVLIGLAGTVLGFTQAVPALRAVLAPEPPVAIERSVGPSQALDAAETPAAGTVPEDAGGEPEPLPGGEDRADTDNGDDEGEDDEASRKLALVLEEIRGIFVATFGGVLGALLLSFCSSVWFEPAFERYANEVDLLGSRWFVPVIHPPDSIIDDALRGELKSYFDEIGSQLEQQLDPLVHSLRTSLEGMTSLSTDFSDNIASGRDTLEAFHRAVEQLGEVSGGAVAELEGIVKTSKDFLRETRDLQESGRKQLESIAQALGTPVRDLASSAAAIETVVGGLNGYVADLDAVSQEIAEAIREHRQGTEELDGHLVLAAETLEKVLGVETKLVSANEETVQRLDKLEGPVRALSESTETTRETATKLGTQLTSLSATMADLAGVLEENREGDTEFRQELERTCKALGELAEAEETTTLKTTEIVKRLEDLGEAYHEVLERAEVWQQEASEQLDESRTALQEPAEVIGRHAELLEESFERLSGEVEVLREVYRDSVGTGLTGADVTSALGETIRGLESHLRANADATKELARVVRKKLEVVQERLDDLAHRDVPELITEWGKPSRDILTQSERLEPSNRRSLWQKIRNLFRIKR